MKRHLPRMSLSLALAWSAAGAHSASDAYLTLSVDPAGNPRGATVHGQWDIALRDLDFVMKLDDDGDGELTWGEVKHHQSAIERYAFEQLRFKDETGAACSVKPGRQMIDGHADGTYAVLYFDVVCGRPAKSLTMDYALFFAIDPSHRGIMVMHSGGNTATAVISPQNAKVVLALQ